MNNTQSLWFFCLIFLLFLIFSLVFFNLIRNTTVKYLILDYNFDNLFIYE